MTKHWKPLCSQQTSCCCIIYLKLSRGVVCCYDSFNDFTFTVHHYNMTLHVWLCFFLLFHTIFVYKTLILLLWNVYIEEKTSLQKCISTNNMIPFPQRKNIKYNVIFSVKYWQIIISVLNISFIAMYFYNLFYLKTS